MNTLTLKAARVNAGISVKEAAKACNVSEGTLYSYEAGKSSPKIGTAIKLARVYGVPIDMIDFICSDNTD